MAALTKQEILKEIVKAGKDPVYFTTSYCRISHPQKGLIPFKAFDYQQDLLKDFRDYRFNIILKARQLGISTISAAYVAWLMLFHKDKNILVVATKLQTATNLVKKVKAIIKNLPKWMQIADITVDNRTSFELSNGSQIKGSSTSGDAGRSEALSLLIIDEAAHVEKLEDLWTALYPTLSTGGRCIALSTPNGVGNWFHQNCVEAEAGTNDFHMTTLMWDVHPERDKKWFEKETRNMSKRQIAQELECNFNVSGETVIHPDDLQWYLEKVAAPEYRTGFDRNYWIWKQYNPENHYLIVADVARGDGKDNSAFHIIELANLEQVAEYVGKPTPDDFADILSNVAAEYGNPMLVIENNNLITINSNRLLSEMKTFIWHHGRPQAMRSYNDDLTMSFAIGCWVRDTVIVESQKNVEYSKSFLSAISTAKTSIATTIPGMQGHKMTTESDRAKQAVDFQHQYIGLIKG
jgi:hypothetical protein